MNEFIKDIVNLDVNKVNNFFTKGNLVFNIDKVSFVFGRYLLKGNVIDEGTVIKTLVCIFGDDFTGEILDTWDKVFMQPLDRDVEYEQIVFGRLKTNFKFKNTKTFRIKAVECFVYDMSTKRFKMFEKLTIKIEKSI